MCGLFGGASSYLSPREVEAITRLGILASFRGTDSTGIAVGKRKKRSVTPRIVKGVTPSTTFFSQHEVIEVMRDRPIFIIGHTRQATVGKLVPALAHPIRAAHIVGAHNGVIRAFEPKDRQSETVSDSTLFFDTLAEVDIEDTVLDAGPNAAIATVYYDTNKQTINFYRNEKRPLYVALVNKGATYYWHSEKEALTYVLSTMNIEHELIEVPVNKCFSVKVSNVAKPELFHSGGLAVKQPRYETPFLPPATNTTQTHGTGSTTHRGTLTQEYGAGNRSTSVPRASSLMKMIEEARDASSIVYSLPPGERCPYPPEQSMLTEEEINRVPPWEDEPAKKVYPTIDLTTPVEPPPAFEQKYDFLKRPSKLSTINDLFKFVGFRGPLECDMSEKEAIAFFTKYSCAGCDTHINPRTDKVLWTNMFDEFADFLCSDCSKSDAVKDLRHQREVDGLDPVTESIGHPLVEMERHA